ncbi:site-specific DNA-methyltransferase [Curtobacterium sp. 458]|uniref:site-specific DNA-methyltransferase n=1 Tax=Curtobacterium sp. 458 TaxID=3050069 RepID=UPI0025B5055E|nr:site-specific DNA-methyltransferase [Curtobacterium sp. 458]WJX99917.1 site-specific DNA-methyltransferase [Curtobacterium sp. 458]
MSEEVHETPSTTPNFQTELAAQLADLIPEAIADGKVDVEKLKELLDGDAADGSERFGLFWPGKKRALRAAQEPTTATLRPDIENSKDWDTTKNVFIEGDNLEVLKILQKHYHAKIKMIYMDPPYNTGKDFVYPDNYKEGLENYLQWTQQVNEQGKKLSTNSDTEGRYHSNWLNMMYPRLKLARNLLTRDGAIFISIDDSEVENLKRLAHEIFGEANFVATMIWAAGRKNDSRLVSVSHEYILVYVRDADYLREQQVTWRQRKKGLDEIYAQLARLQRTHGSDYNSMTEGMKAWYRGLPDSHPSKAHKHYAHVDRRGLYFPDNISWPGGGGPKYEVLHPLTQKAVKVPSRGWMTSDPAKMQSWIDDDRVHFGVDENSVPCIKSYLRDKEYQTPYSVFYQDGRAATKRLMNLFGSKVFDFPKDESVIESLIEMCTSSDDLILDCFSGSGTTAHAVMRANVEDGGSRRHIQVQLPEPTPSGSPARETGYSTIAELSRARIDLSGAAVLDAQASKGSTAEGTLDVGFRAYTLADTSFSKWKVSSDVDRNQLEQHLFDLRESSSADDASASDLLSEILLKQGYSLTEQISTLDVAGLSLQAVGGGVVLAYLDEHVKPTLEQLRAVVDEDPARLIVLEDAFQGDDQLKTNLAQLCKSKGIELWTA